MAGFATATSMGVVSAPGFATGAGFGAQDTPVQSLSLGALQ